ncbi:MAG TPA: hypothetical protein VKZ41_04795 [Gemmatimonadales bacterium]|nr:hypothetical protein [Gemmatimonadales bacterium]
MPLVSLASLSLQSLRSAILESRGAEGVRILQEAGYATGDALYNALTEELNAEGSASPDQLPSDAFAVRLGAFMRARGWGEVNVLPDEDSGDAVAIIVTVQDGAEARAAGGCEDGSPFTTGVLSGLLSRLVEAPVAVMAVETGGAEAPLFCRFLAASPAAVQVAWEAMAAGRSWREALRT